ncbi:MAG TPA: EamA family transporter [Bryobacteraceae bacterium]|nr:EamA family transporter [Bryobacteraceae bacterium]
MSTATTGTQAPVVNHAKRREAVFIILAGTFLVAVAQMLIKSGADRLAQSGQTGLIGTAIGILTIPPLFAGYALYAVFAVMMIYSLKHGEMSVLFPLISLGFVWVAILSVFILHEAMSPLKGAGIAIIVAGVAILGRGGSH